MSSRTAAEEVSDDRLVQIAGDHKESSVGECRRMAAELMRRRAQDAERDALRAEVRDALRAEVRLPAARRTEYDARFVWAAAYAVRLAELDRVPLISDATRVEHAVATANAAVGRLEGRFPTPVPGSYLAQLFSMPAPPLPESALGDIVAALQDGVSGNTISDQRRGELVRQLFAAAGVPHPGGE